MGVVYKALDTHLDRFVALKLLPPEALSDPDRRRRFVQEAKAASALRRPAIVTIHDIDAFEGTWSIAIEYVASTTLDRLIPARGVRLREALRIAIQVTEAMAKAHSAGILHRDLKPGNLIVAGEGTVSSTRAAMSSRRDVL